MNWASYLGQPLTLNDLNQLIDEINRLYKVKGYLAAKAFLPPQKINDGIVIIRLIEGRIGDIKLEGNDSTNSDYLLERLNLSLDDLVEVNSLEKELARLNLLNDIQVAISLKPGSKLGQTDYLLNIKEPKRQEVFIYTDNAGTKDVGLYRFGFNYIDRSLSGRRDLLNIGGYVARGTKAFYASSHFPLNLSGTKLRLSGNTSKINIVDGPIKPLDISGESYALGAELSHPVLVDKDDVIIATVAVRKKRSTTASTGVNLFEVDVNTIDFGIKRQVYSLNSISYTSLIGTVAPKYWKNSSSFFKVNADFSYNRILKNDWQALLRLGAQWSDTKLLPSLEQFQVGGVYTVRGYVEGLLIGDKGYYSSIELSHAIPSEMKNVFGRAGRYLIFLDHGAAIPFKGNNEGTNRDDFLTSLGVGLNFQIADTLSVQLTAAKPLMSRKDKNDSGRVNFTIQTNF
jgi:hemolysin activation/secretion protein